MTAGRFDAAFLAVGAHIAKRAYIPAGEAAHMLDAVSVLRSMEGEDKPMLGRRVVVYGGGNTALDVARTAKRLGATEAIIVYRRTREKMPAHDFEIEEALQEGVLIKWLSTIKNMADEGTLTVEKMALDAKGFPQPTGEFETLEADSLVLALGQDVDLSLLDGVPGLDIKDGTVQVGRNMMTGYAGIFAGGDMVPSERTVTVGVGHGKKAARHIHAWLSGDTYAPAAKARARDVRHAQPLVFQRCAQDDAPIARARPPHLHVRRGRRRSHRRQRAVRGASLPVLRQLLRVRQLLRGVPRQRGDQAWAGQAIRVQFRLLQGLWHLRVRMSLRRDQDGSRDRLKTPTRRTAGRAARRQRDERRGDERCCRKVMTMQWANATSTLPIGIALLQDPALNKGTAFTEAERDALHLRGLLPPHVSSQEQQLGRVLENFRRKSSDLEKYINLTSAARPQRGALLPPPDGQSG